MHVCVCGGGGGGGGVGVDAETGRTHGKLENLGLLRGRQHAIRWYRLLNGPDIWITNTNCPTY